MEMRRININLIENLATNLASLVLDGTSFFMSASNALWSVFQIFSVDLEDFENLMESSVIAIYLLATQLLCLALLSYSNAHIGPLQPFFLDCSLHRINLFEFDSTNASPGVVRRALSSHVSE